MKKNILFICVDQQRRDSLGYVGEYPVKTPSIDRLANEGFDFENAYTPTPICVPARRSMVCGLRPEKVGTMWNYDQGIPSAPLPEDLYSWSADLKKAGYYCGYIGCWHVSDTVMPTDLGYDDYISVNDLGVKDGTAYESGFFGDVCNLPVCQSGTHRMADKAIELMKAHSNEPFQIRVNFPEPHLPCRPCEPFASMYGDDTPMWAAFDDDLKEKPFMQRQMVYNWANNDMPKEKFARTQRLYFGMISQIDDAIGKMLTYLDESGLASDTVVVYTSDHGDMCGERRMLDKHYIMYESVVKTPLIVRYPGKSRRRISDPVINALDLVPTFLGIAGVEKRPELDGLELLPYFNGAKPEKARKYALVTYNGQQFGLYTQRMISDGRVKYIWNCSDKDELYFLDADPHELHNAVDDPEHAELLARLRREMVKQLREADDYTMRSPWLVDMLYNGRKAK